MQTVQLEKTTQPMSLTGLVIFVLGLLTFSPEIYISGLMVMAVSFSLQLKYFETQRIEQHIVPVNVSQNQASAEAFYAW